MLSLFAIAYITILVDELRSLQGPVQSHGAWAAGRSRPGEVQYRPVMPASRR